MTCRFVVSCVLLSFTSLRAAEESSAHQAMLLAQEAREAAAADDPAKWLAKAEEAAALRPDFPRLLMNLAAAQTANEQFDQAVATLERVAATGYHDAVDKAEEFAALRARPDFLEVAKKFAENRKPKGKGEIAFTLRDVTGLIEGIAWRESTGDFYFGDVHHRAVWVRGAKEAKDGKPRRLTPESDELLGIFGITIDEANGTLWAAMSAVSAMQGYSPEMEGTAGVAEIDLASGDVRRVILLPKSSTDRAAHVLGDVAIAPDGSVLLTDSGAPIVWRLAPGSDELRPLVEHAELISPQGLAVLPAQDALLVADHVNGLVRLALNSGDLQRLESPADSVLTGFDGLTRAPDGTIIAIQNGLRPNRVVQITLNSGGDAVENVTVLESAHLQMGDPTLGCIGPDGRFYFIANAGWSRFQTSEGPTAPRAVAIFKTAL